MSNGDHIAKLAVRDYHCPYCGAPKGHTCVSQNGKRASQSHLGRWRLAQKAFFATDIGKAMRKQWAAEDARRASAT